MNKCSKLTLSHYNWHLYITGKPLESVVRHCIQYLGIVCKVHCRWQWHILGKRSKSCNSLCNTHNWHTAKDSRLTITIEAGDFKGTFVLYIYYYMLIKFLFACGGKVKFFCLLVGEKWNSSVCLLGKSEIIHLWGKKNNSSVHLFFFCVEKV